MARWRRQGACALFLGLWVICAAPASAHAVLERSDPPANASLRQSPGQIVLRFTEPIDAALSTLTVLDREGRRVSGPTAVSADRRGMGAVLPALAEGIYTVKWRVLSSLDGHTTSGAFLFAVGLSVQLTPGEAPAATPNPTTVAVHWIALASAVVLTGCAVFRVIVLRPALSGTAAGDARSLRSDAAESLRTTAWVAGAVFLASIVTYFFRQGTELVEGPVWRIFSSGVFGTLLIDTKLGWSVLLQSSLATLLLGLARRPGRADVISDVIAVVAAVGLLGGFTITSHAVGRGTLAIMADWLHLIATGIWIGGLVSLFVALRRADRSDRRHAADPLVSRFSTVAGGALGVLIVTGAYSTWMQVPALRAFTETPYGRTLLVKLVIVVPLVGLGAINRFLLVPMLKSQDAGMPPLLRTLLGVVGGEVFLGALVLAVVAALTITPPATVTLPKPPTAGPRLGGYAGDTRISLSVVPGQPGWNRFEIGAERSGRPVGADTRVLLRLTKLDEELDPVLLRPVPQEAGRFAVEAGEMALPGWWDLEVIVRRPGQLDVSTSFALRLGEPRTAPADQSAERLVEEARRAVSALRSWREALQLADGTGGVAVTWFAVQAPDRMHYQTPGGTEVIVVGRTRYIRSGQGPWERDTLAEPFRAQGPLTYLREMRGAALGRRMPCAEETCQVVLWEWDRTTAFAALIGSESHRVHKIVMAAPAHFMTIVYGDFNGRIRIAAPR